MIFKETELPESCPPLDTIQQNVKPVYRYLVNEEISEIDFLNHRERNIPYKPHEECEALAISFFTTEQSAKRMAIKYKSFRKRTLSVGQISKECGVHKTANNHLNLWLFKDVNMLDIFSKGEEENEDK